MTAHPSKGALRAPLLVSLALMPLVYWVTWRVMTGPFSPEVQSMVAGAVMGTALGAMTNFWLGSSAGSARKTELAGEAKAQEPAPPPEPKD